MDRAIDLLIDAAATCGESPIWDPEAQLLWWADTATNLVHSWNPATATAHSRQTDRTVRAIARGGEGRLVLVCADGIYSLEAGSSSCRFLCDPERGRADMLPDDGTIDPAGRLIFDTFNGNVFDDPSGSIYSLDSAGRVSLLDTGLKLPNGIAFSPDGRTMYVAEMFAHRLLRYDYDPAAGTASHRETFVDIPSADGMPDGLIVDAEGYIWNAHWSGWRITRYSRDGEVDRVVRLPFATATCAGFGGPSLEDLYITTARMGLSPEEIARSRAPGGLFVIRGAGRGIEEGVFGSSRAWK